MSVAGLPPNIRELQNVIERAVITSTDGRLLFNLPIDAQVKRPSVTEPSTVTEKTEILTDADIRHHERENLLAALKRTKWRISGEGGAAEMLGLKPNTLTSRMKKMEIERPV